MSVSANDNGAPPEHSPAEILHYSTLVYGLQTACHLAYKYGLSGNLVVSAVLDVLIGMIASQAPASKEKILEKLMEKLPESVEKRVAEMAAGAARELDSHKIIGGAVH